MVSAAHPSHPSSSTHDDASTPPASSTSTSSGEQPTKTRGGTGAPKPPSGKRAAANRANARKSTGPRTPAGRARSRFNALKHGLCARVVLLPGEDWREYQAFAKQFADDLKPLGVIQEMLAGRAAALAWALQRLPDAAGDLAERGERRRFERWFDGRGLRDQFEAMFAREYGGDVSRSGPDDLAAVADAELANARADGNPPPDDRDAAGIVADALAGGEDDAFAAILKLEEHERRLWSALLSVLRALERRQKLDGRAEGGGAGAEDEADVGDEGERSGEDPGAAEVLDDARAVTHQDTTDSQNVAESATADPRIDPAPARNEANVGSGTAPQVDPAKPTTVPPVATDGAPENFAASEAERAVEGDNGTADESGTSAQCDVPSRGCAALRHGVARAPAQRCAPARNEANEVGLGAPTTSHPEVSGEPGA